jgi:hypothetical protein
VKKVMCLNCLDQQMFWQENYKRFFCFKCRAVRSKRKVKQEKLGDNGRYLSSCCTRQSLKEQPSLLVIIAKQLDGLDVSSQLTGYSLALIEEARRTVLSYRQRWVETAGWTDPYPEDNYYD